MNSFYRRVVAIAAFLVSFSPLRLCAQQPPVVEADPTVAVKTVMSLFTPNPQAQVAASGKPLATSGTWGAQVKFPSGPPHACALARVPCAVVIYRVPEQGTICEWAVGFALVRKQVPGQEATHVLSAMILDENNAASLYTMKKSWADGEPVPRPIEGSRPAYPELARQSSIGGVVAVHLIVGPDGAVKDAIAMSGPAMLRESVLKAVRGWKYDPLSIGQQPTSFALDRQFTFNVTMPEMISDNGGTIVLQQADPHYAQGSVKSGVSSGTWESCTGAGCSLVAPEVPH